MESPQTMAPESWEYMVIHLNIEPGPTATAPGAAKPPEGGGSEEAGPAKPVFSESFLKKEFPQFYESRPAQERPAQAQPQHPAQQLQNFLNGHGAQGWELIGVFPVGALTMLFFRRRLPTPPVQPASSQGATPTAEPTASPSPEGSTASPPPASAAASADRDALLEAVLARLTALEQGLSRPSPEPPPAPPRRRPPSRGQASGPGSGPLIPAAQLKRWADETPLPSSTAAQAIGLRSAASLANHGARHGFRKGLCKIGPNGMAAIYVGQGEPERGGLARRLWIVVAAERLQG